MATANPQLTTQLDAATVLDELLDRLETFFASQVRFNGHWDTRVAQVDLIVKKVFSDSSLLELAGPRVQRLIAALRSHPIAPPGVLEHLEQIRDQANRELDSFEYVMEWYAPEEFAALLDKWLRTVDSEYYKCGANVRTLVLKFSKETERRVAKLKKQAKCPIIEENEETD
ncbi:MAG TPA: hypothetical protein VGQ87_03640 [Patescibacteria group bacterium]|jgi:hypothetical protein|nr:hypothetical protein [Patescibacteria group bacterium]